MSPFTLDSGPVRKPSIRLIVKPTNEELAAGVVPPPPRTWPLLPTASQKAQLKKEEAELRKLAKEIEQEKSIEAGIETGNYSYSSDTDSISLDGEFHVDLYTLPDHLVQMLWSFVTQLN